MKLKICHLYPDALNLYGDIGNLIAIKRRCESRGIEIQIDSCLTGEKLKADEYDMFFIGGGQDLEQGELLRDIRGDNGKAIISAIEDEKVVLAIGSGYQLMGNYYISVSDVRTELLGAVDMYTVGAKGNMAGDCMIVTFPEDISIRIVGFENHWGKTYLGENVKPLGIVVRGYGNNGEDSTEGMRYKNVFATYMHGALLPKNPVFCDLILTKALKRKYGHVYDLEPLDDSVENTAHNYIEQRLKCSTALRSLELLAK